MPRDQTRAAELVAAVFDAERLDQQALRAGLDLPATQASTPALRATATARSRIVGGDEEGEAGAHVERAVGVARRRCPASRWMKRSTGGTVGQRVGCDSVSSARMAHQLAPAVAGDVGAVVRT